MTTTVSPLQHQAQDAEGLRAALVNALDGHTRHSRDCHLSGEFLASRVWPIIARALSASPPQAETSGLDREAIKSTLRRWHENSSYLPENDELETGVDAILAATAVSQPPTTRQGAEDVEALRRLDAECAKAKAQHWLPSATEVRFGEACAEYVRTHVLPAQPGPAPVGEGGAVEALKDDLPLAEQAKHHGRDWAVWWQGSGERGDHIMEVAQSGLGYARELTFLGADHHDQAGTLVAEHNEQVRRLREVIARQAAAKTLLQKEVAHLQSEAEFSRHNAGPSPWPEPWKRCPSTHCERSEECRSPHDCTVRSAPATGEHSADAILAAAPSPRSPAMSSDRIALAEEISNLRKTASLQPWVKAKTFADQRYRGDILSACKGHPQKPVAHMLGQQDYGERLANADLTCLVMSNLDTIEAALRADHDAGGAVAMREAAWRALDDCPEDGRWIWVVGGRYDEPFRTKADGGFWRYAAQQGSKAPPTHWHPDIVLPPIPAALASQEGSGC